MDRRCPSAEGPAVAIFFILPPEKRTGRASANEAGKFRTKKSPAFSMAMTACAAAKF
jgi:hypothetical protein